MVKLILIKKSITVYHIIYLGCDRCMEDEERCPSGKMVKCLRQSKSFEFYNF